jgi:hypothetical protein
MKDIYKNPTIYYIAIPIIIGLWPLLVWAIYLPAAQDNLKKEFELCKNANDIMMEILTLDPQRLELADPNETDTEFSYYREVNRIASICGIPPSKCDNSTQKMISSAGQRNQTANVKLTEIDITTFTNFLSKIQARWPKLQCNRLKLTQKKGTPDVWTIDIEFRYFF